jgi:tetratricopeptide (TPR) repeat protein
MAEEHLEKVRSGTKFNIMCLLGEMKRDHTYWERAWEESNHRCSKAMRNLGNYYFFENKFDKSIECFNNSLQINRLYPDIWFTLGCAYMRNEDFNNAIYAFGTVVSIDDRRVEAWANIANCYIV